MLDLFKTADCRWICKLTQSIVIDIQRQSADLYKVQLCQRMHFGIIVDSILGLQKIAGSQQSNVIVFITCRSEVTDLPSLSIIFTVFRDFFTEAAIRLEN